MAGDHQLLGGAGRLWRLPFPRHMSREHPRSGIKTVTPSRKAVMCLGGPRSPRRVTAATGEKRNSFRCLTGKCQYIWLLLRGFRPENKLYPLDLSQGIRKTTSICCWLVESGRIPSQKKGSAANSDRPRKHLRCSKDCFTTTVGIRGFAEIFYLEPLCQPLRCQCAKALCLKPPPCTEKRSQVNRSGLLGARIVLIESHIALHFTWDPMTPWQSKFPPKVCNAPLPSPKQAHTSLTAQVSPAPECRNLPQVPSNQDWLRPVAVAASDQKHNNI